MKRTSLIVTVFVLMSLLFVGLRFLPDARATTLYVGGAGPGNYTAIQAAIDDAADGDVIYVYNGTYYEHVTISKTLSLVAENGAIINANGTGDAIHVSVDWVNITGFVVDNSGSSLHDAGIELYNVKKCLLSNVTAVNSKYGIYLRSSDANIIEGNNITDNQNGIYLRYSENNDVSRNNVSFNGRGMDIRDSRFNVIAGNTVWKNSRGIVLDSSDENTLSDNTVHSNNLVNIELDSSNNNIITTNVISNSVEGIRLESSDSTTLENNSVQDNSYGIWLMDSNNTSISNNTVSSNTWMGFYHHSSTNSTFMDNVMVGNGIYLTGVLRHWNTHAIYISNTVNSKPVRYWKDVVGGSVPADAGQVILANCTDVVVENENILDATAGIQIGFSSRITVRNNTLSSNSAVGILLVASNNSTVGNNTATSNLVGISIGGFGNTIVDNTASDNYYGIALGSSRNTTATYNTAYGNSYGIYSHSCRNITVRENEAFGNDQGMHVNHTLNSTFVANEVFSNSKGFYIWLALNVTVTSNNIFWNGGPGIEQHFSYHNNITANNISENREGIYVSYSLYNVIASNEIYSNSDDGIYFHSTANMTISDNNVSDNRDDGIHISSSTYSTVTNNSVSYNDMHGMNLGFVRRSTIDGNTVRFNNIFGIFLDYSNNNTLSGNNASDSQVGIALWSSHDDVLAGNTIADSNPYGIYIFASGNITLLNNTVSRCTEEGILLLMSDNNTVAGNQVDTSFLYGGISLRDSSDNIIVGNDLASNEMGVYLWSSNNNTVVGNTANQHNIYGIYLRSSNENTIADNRADGNHYGIYLNVSSENIVNNNTLLGNYDAGIFSDSSDSNTIIYNIVSLSGELPPSPASSGVYLGYSSNNTIAHNEVSWNKWNGVSLYFSHNNTLVDNELLGNDHDGIHLFSCSNNTIARNSVDFNGMALMGTGINLTSSVGNRIYHNRITLNKVQAHDDDTNQWDDGYPSGGNYWSDYLGPDLYRGPGQDIPGRDGIGDFPYPIETNGIDNYPLVTLNMSYPRPPENVRAILDGDDYQNVTVIWDPSPEESLGFIVSYDVYRGENYSIDGELYLHIGSVPSGTHEFMDSFAGQGDPKSHFYVVCARNASGASTCDENQAAKFTRPLARGPNLVSVPIIQSSESIETVLQTVEYDKAWFYDSSSQEWKWYTTSKSYRRGLWNVNHTVGLWVNVTADCNLTVAGIVPAQTTKQLFKGWNLVSFPSFNTSYAVSDLKAETGATKVEGYNPTPPYYLRILTDAEALQAGYGYWVRVDVDTVWTIEVT